MRFLIQRVADAKVETEGEIVGCIQNGYLVLMGVCASDTEEILRKMVKKLLGLRIFADEQGKTNCSLKEAKGEVLLVSQFTLYADCRKGNRPSFTNAGGAGLAEDLYNKAAQMIRDEMGEVQTGRFGAHMKVSLCNDGPFTVMLDSAELFGGN